MKTVLAQWHRGIIYIEEKDGKKILTKKAKDKSKKWSIKKEIKILKKLNRKWLDFVPYVLEEWEDFFQYEYIDGDHFKKVFEDASYKKQLRLVSKLIEKTYQLDKMWVYHWEMSKPYTNILVTDKEDIYIIDFERGGFMYGNQSNLRDLAQFIYRNKLISYKIVRKIWDLDRDKIYKILTREIKKRKARIYLRYVFLGLGLLWLDLVTKYVFYDLEALSYIRFITRVFNDWITLGIQVPYFFPFLVFGVVSVIGGILLYRKHISPLLYILFLAWGLWNLLDRVCFGGVRDFINLPYWPVFNMADIYLTLFILGLFYREFRVFLKD